jgi:hypothetical protein
MNPLAQIQELDIKWHSASKIWMDFSDYVKLDLPTGFIHNIIYGMHWNDIPLVYTTKNARENVLIISAACSDKQDEQDLVDCIKRQLNNYLRRAYGLEYRK